MVKVNEKSYQTKDAYLSWRLTSSALGLSTQDLGFRQPIVPASFVSIIDVISDALKRLDLFDKGTVVTERCDGSLLRPLHSCLRQDVSLCIGE